MKTVSVPTDWLNEITGRTVANAIAYLSTLPPDHELTYWQSGGDDHGVEISSKLTYQRPYTEQELAELVAMREARKIGAFIAYCDTQAAYWDGHDNYRAAAHRRNAAIYRQRLEELT